jgi:hypothetical protein
MRRVMNQPAFARIWCIDSGECYGDFRELKLGCSRAKKRGFNANDFSDGRGVVHSLIVSNNGSTEPRNVGRIDRVSPASSGTPANCRTTASDVAPDRRSRSSGERSIAQRLHRRIYRSAGTGRSTKSPVQGALAGSKYRSRPGVSCSGWRFYKNGQGRSLQYRRPRD